MDAHLEVGDNLRTVLIVAAVAWFMGRALIALIIGAIR